MQIEIEKPQSVIIFLLNNQTTFALKTVDPTQHQQPSMNRGVVRILGILWLRSRAAALRAWVPPTTLNLEYKDYLDTNHPNPSHQEETVKDRSYYRKIIGTLPW